MAEPPPTLNKLLVTEHTQRRAEHPSQLVPVSSWRKSIGKGETTIWRWKKNGWLPPGINIGGKSYLTRGQIAEFEARAFSGEFAKPFTGALAESQSKGGANSGP
jgi:predicted DNA-binding transcriptional regulator AlpA